METFRFRVLSKGNEPDGVLCVSADDKMSAFKKALRWIDSNKTSTHTVQLIEE